MADYKPGDRVAIHADWNRDPEMMPKPARTVVVTLDGWHGNDVQVLDDNDVYGVPRDQLMLVARSLPMTPERIDALEDAADALDYQHLKRAADCDTQREDDVNIPGGCMCKEHEDAVRAMVAEARGEVPRA